MLEKVEELTLYTLQQQEELQALRTENTLLKEQMASLRSEQVQVQALVAQLFDSQPAQTMLASETTH